MREGAIVAEGNPAEIVDAALVERVFGLRSRVIADPETGLPADRPGAPMTRPFPLHTGIATVTAIRALTPRDDALHAARARLRRSRASSSPARSSRSAGPPTARSWCCRSSAGASRTASPSSTGATSPCARFDPARATIDVDFYLHGDIGRASAWARRAAVGDPVGYAGPAHALGARPGGRWCLLAADETGLPALLAILESLPAGLRAIALAEVADEGERQAVASAADVDLRWVSRDGGPPGTTPC